VAARFFPCPARLGRKADAIGKKIHKWRYNVKVSLAGIVGVLGHQHVGRQSNRLSLSPS
jgi:hypothetical protein